MIKTIEAYSDSTCGICLVVSGAGDGGEGVEQTGG